MALRLPGAFLRSHARPCLCKPRFDPATEALKVPHSVEAEQAVLGGLMLENSAWDQVADLIGEEDFYRRDHRLLFRAISELAHRNTPFDIITLSEQLAAINELDNAGGLAYLGTLAKNTPPPPISRPMPLSCASVRCCGN